MHRKYRQLTIYKTSSRANLHGHKFPSWKKHSFPFAEKSMSGFFLFITIMQTGRKIWPNTHTHTQIAHFLALSLSKTSRNVRCVLIIKIMVIIILKFPRDTIQYTSDCQISPRVLFTPLILTLPRSLATTSEIRFYKTAKKTAPYYNLTVAPPGFHTKTFFFRTVVFPLACRTVSPAHHHQHILLFCVCIK